jgi:glycosyltransferase involved in cell wall biosynthesis
LLKGVFFFLLSRPDLVHFQWLADRKQDYYLIRLLKLLGFKTIYTVHDLLPHDSHTADDVTACQKIYRQVDKLIVHAESNKNEMISLFDIEPAKVCVVSHGSNDLFFDRDISKEEARGHLTLPQDRRIVLFFGLIKRYKGLEYLIESFEEVKQSVENAMLLIGGQIYEADREVYNRYSRLISKLAGRDDIICNNRYIPFDEVPYYFAAADVVVLPYTKTSQSGILLSAYAAGRPVVVTDTGGLSEVVRDGKSGYVVPPRDVKALTTAVIRVLQSPAQMECMGNYAKQLAETTYSWKKAASDTINVYRSLRLQQLN